MSVFIAIGFILAALAVVGSLVIGLIGFAQGGEFNRKYGNRLMRIRVLMQGTAVIMLVLMAMIASK